MLRSASQVEAAQETDGLPGVYMDVRLKKSARLYAGDCKKRALVDYTTRPAAELGVFFVAKKNGVLLLIIDCRKVNQLFATPPSTDLIMGEELSQIECACEDSVPQPIQVLFLHFGIVDVSTCFHRLRLDDKLRCYFCWPSLAASSLGLVGKELDGKVLSVSDRVWPRHCSLPMGFNWATYFAQSASLFMLESSLEAFGSHRLYDAHYSYIDNLGLLNESKENYHDSLLERRKSLTIWV